MRNSLVCALACLWLGCSAATPPAPTSVQPDAEPAAPWSDAWLLEQGQVFLHDDAARRQALEQSLSNPENLYSRQRLNSYGRVQYGWDLLPEWNPRSRRVDAAIARSLELDEVPEVSREHAPLWDGQTPTTMAEWVALGERVFFEYPMRAEVFAEFALTKPELARAVGLERTSDGAVPGLVVFADTDGRSRVGITCALCHSAVHDGQLVVGAARRRFDYGRLRLAFFDEFAVTVDPNMSRRLASWGPGRADVTEDDDEDPVAIPDLWGLRSQRWLTQAATIRHQSPLALAIRQETQLTDSNHLKVRPPRELAWALAMFVYSLEPRARQQAPTSSEFDRGRALFASECQGCHANAAYGGAPLPAQFVGTDPSLATGRGRGTGSYRVPSLLAVGAGAPYLHDGSVASLEELLAPDRLAPSYVSGLLGPGALTGHEAGTQLSLSDRKALLAFLDTL
jgi:mono/diheme cytochrome c family protein